MLPFTVLMPLLWALPAETAGAPPPPSPTWWLQEPPSAVVQVPLEGVVVVPAFWEDHTGQVGEVGLDWLDVTVTALDGEDRVPVMGEVTWLEGPRRALWTATTPLTPSGEYDLAVQARNVAMAEALGLPSWSSVDASTTWRLVAAAEATPAPVDPTLVEVEPGQHSAFIEVCCDTSAGLCAEGCGGCGRVSVVMPRALLTLAHGLPEALSSYVLASAHLTGPGGYVLTHFSAQVRGDVVEVFAPFDVPLDTYCVTVEVQHLVHAETRSTEVCLGAAELPARAFGPEVPAEGACFEPAVAKAAGADSDGGCQGASAPPSSWLLALVALAALRRRARLASSAERC